MIFTAVCRYLKCKTSKHKSKTKCRNRSKQYREECVAKILADMKALVAHSPSTFWTSDTIRLSYDIIPRDLNQHNLTAITHTYL